MNFPCDQCGINLDTEEDYEECGMCGNDICISCMNGQYNCEACLEEEKEGEEEIKCQHTNTLPSYEYVTCQDCGWYKTGSGWGANSFKWFKNLPKRS